MKNRNLILGALSLILLAACEKLDREFVTSLSEKQVSKSYDYISYTVASIYNELPSGFLPIDGAMMASASDEAEHTLETSAVQKFNVGAWNAYDNPDNVLEKYFRAIRKANQVLSMADSVNLDIYRLDPDPAAQIVYKNRVEEIKRWKYEVRLLKAYFYFELVKRYGGVPIIDNIFSLGDNFDQVNRNTLANCIQYITDECDSASSGLPIKYAIKDMGRVTKGTALALKSRVLLYAASDLYNDPAWATGFADPDLISLPSGNRNDRWKAAADAARAFIDSTGSEYALSSDYPSLFRTFNDPEMILVCRAAASNEFEIASYPVGFDLGRGGTNPSQNLVDAYEMADGAKFDWNNPPHSADPYANRDPRLGYSILTNYAMFKGRHIESFPGGKDGKGIPFATKTGYYIKKYVDENIDLLTGTSSVLSWIIFRLAEIYLNYAEALNEYSPGNPDIEIYLNMVRQRPGVDLPAVTGLSQSEMREKIRNERRVELAFEDHRLWDLRRWMQASAELAKPLKGVEITTVTDSTFNYKVINVENRSFENMMYFYPIPQTEIVLTGWPQNPLW